MIKTLDWTQPCGLGMFGRGKTAPADGAMCLVAKDIRGRRYIVSARYSRRLLSGRFIRSDGSTCSIREIDGWMDAQPVISFIKGSTQEMPA